MELVYYKKLQDELYTTNEIIGKYTGVAVPSINKAIKRNERMLKEFGVLRHGVRKPLAGSSGGRPTKIYKLNEQQATFLITLLDNTPQVKEFKKALVKAFYSMKQELDQAKLNRELNKRANIGLAELIKAEFP
ncbi:hypothetical protein FFRU_130010, partial [Fructobacillus fructosus]|uniref:Rha family transcriptional regulator n=3 Tax=Fructobacillus fructosus TaxID=1631 RepID=UPI0006757F5E